MEDETMAFLLRILNSISVVLLWMMLNIFFGIYKNFGFFNDVPHWYNYLYYFLALASLAFVIRYLIRKWSV